MRIGLLAIVSPWLVATSLRAQERPPQGIVDWEVKDRFRLFDQADAKSRARVEQAMQEVHRKSEQGVDSEALHDILRDTLGLHEAKALRRSNFAPHNGIETVRSGRYAPDYLYPEAYVVRVRAPHRPPNDSCKWRVGSTTVQAACGSFAELQLPANESGNGAVADLFLSAGDAPEQLAEKLEIRDMLVVAMGDSYISGEGNPDVPAKFHVRADARFSNTHWPAKLQLGPDGDVEPATWWDQPCHRSLLSWPVLASFMHSAQNPKQAVTLVHLGCSGDEVTDGVAAPRKSLPGGGSENESQFAMLEQLRRRSGQIRPVDKYLLAIGGNDIGFAPVVAALLLPPNGWRAGNFLASFAGEKAATACPYKRESKPLSRFCGDKTTNKKGEVTDRRSAQERLTELPDLLKLLASKMEGARIKPASVYQITYPNALLDHAEEPCRTALSKSQLRRLKRGVDWSWLLGDRRDRKEHLADERAYATNNYWRVDGGFEGLIAQVGKKFRGKRPWAFQVQYYPEKVVDDRLGGSSAECDWEVEPTDSEFCQGYWVWASLNKAIVKQAHKQRWTVVDGFQPAVGKRGWCNANEAFQLRLPRLDAGKWADGWDPSDWKPYDKDLPRWFRTTNDSILTQFETVEHHHKGTMHPTYRAHLEIALAVLREAFENTAASPRAASLPVENHR